MSSQSVKGPPIACLHRRARDTWCGRWADTDEFIFEDAAYAMRNYAKSTVIQVCSSCAARFKGDETQPDLSNVATRGLKDFL